MTSVMACRIRTTGSAFVIDVCMVVSAGICTLKEDKSIPANYYDLA